MKKSVKLIAAACASVMALSGALTTAAAAADTSLSASVYGDVSELDSYLLSQIRNAIPVEGGYYIPGIRTVISEEQYRELCNRYFNSIYYPSYPGWWDPSYPTYPNYPFLPGDGSQFQTIELEMNRFEYQSLGSSYFTYYSSDTSVVTVDMYGRAYAVGAGTATITASSGYVTYIIYQVTVHEADPSEAGFSVRMYAQNQYLTVGDSTRIVAYLLKNGSTVPAASIDIESDSPEIVAVSGNTATALSDGTATITATLRGTDISDSVTIYVSSASYPSYPDYPSYPWTPSYPWYPSYPWGDANGKWEVSTPGGSNGLLTSNIANWLNLDTTRFSVQYKTMYFNGSWTQAFVVVPKDGTVVDFSAYDIQYRNLYLNGVWARVMVLVPQGVDITKQDKPEKPAEPVEPSLTPEEIEALKQKEAEEKRLKELQEKIADALSGKLDWYDVYGDIYGDSYYSAGVAFVLDHQYISGKNDGTFGANDAVTYADVKEMFLKYFHLTDKEFDGLGILSFTDGTKTITRQELALAFYKAAQKLDAVNGRSADLSGYADYADLKADNREAFSWAIANKLLNKTSSKLTPNGTVEKTRLAQMLYMLDRLSK